MMNPVIETRGLTKVFRTYRKEEGLAGAVRGLFHRHLIGNRFLWEGDGKQVVLVKAPD